MSFENSRLIKIVLTFNGTNGAGQVGSIDTSAGLNNTADIYEGEWISEVFYRVNTPLETVDPVNTNLQLGIPVYADDGVLNSTTGNINTLNANSAGFKPVHSYNKNQFGPANQLSGSITGGGATDVTAGQIELLLTVSRANTIITDQELKSVIPPSNVV